VKEVRRSIEKGGQQTAGKQHCRECPPGQKDASPNAAVRVRLQKGQPRSCVASFLAKWDMGAQEGAQWLNGPRTIESHSIVGTQEKKVRLQEKAYSFK